MQADSLYRLSFKCLIKNQKGEILLVKESGRMNWDLPGGGMDFGEKISDCLKRELQEEVAYTGDFKYSVIAIENPVKLGSREIYQVRVIVRLYPDSFNFGIGAESDKVAFLSPDILKGSDDESERAIYEYAQLDTSGMMYLS